MSEQEQKNIALAKKGYEAFTAGDVVMVMSLYDDNVEWIQPGDSAISGTHRGKGELGQLLGRLAEKSTTVKPHRFLADGDTVVVLSEVTAGNETSRDAQVFTFRDGKITRARMHSDTALMERVFGRKPVATA